MASTSASWKELGAEKIHTIWRSQGERKQKNGIRKSTLLYSNLLCDNQSSKDGYLLKAPAPCNTIILGPSFNTCLAGAKLYLNLNHTAFARVLSPHLTNTRRLWLGGMP